MPDDISLDTISAMPSATKSRGASARMQAAPRVLVHPATLLSRADKAMVNDELCAAYLANTGRNLDLLEEFAPVDFGAAGQI
jgi:hypothetical protein